MATKKKTTKATSTTIKKKDLETKIKNRTSTKEKKKQPTKKEESTTKIIIKETIKTPRKKSSVKKIETPKKTTSKKKTVSKEVQINTQKEKAPIKEQYKNINLKKVQIILLQICKVLLICVKNINKFVITQYNNIKGRIGSLNNTKKKSTKQKTKNKKIKIKTVNEPDELNLLRYRDYEGLAKITVFFINRLRVMKFDMKRFKKKFKYGTLKDKLLILFMIFLIVGFSCFIAFAVYIVVTAPDISEERLYKSSSSVFYDVNGNEFARIGLENREKITYDDIPEVLIDAIVSAEDSRFFQHNGMDVARFTKAVLGQLMGRNDAGGGSTLTMQLSKNAATNNTASGIKGIIRKFQDIYLAVFVFEKQYTKEQIMEFYVNLNNLGAGAYGVEQASKVYFGKSASELTLVEAATIAGLFQAPSAYNPYAHPQAAENRRNIILNLMCRHGYISEEERDAAKAVPMSSLLVGQTSSSSEWQDFIDTVRVEVKKRTGYDPMTTSMNVYTTMNPDKQRVVNDIINGKTFTFKTEKSQAGIAVVDVDTGGLAAVGASRDPGELVFNHATSISRHPGSTAKPILDYGPAIEYLGWSTGQTVIDDKMTYTGGGSIKNFDNGHKGIMTAKTALAQSRNIPALYTFQQTTNEQKLEFSNNLGWHAEDKSGYIVESASIGGFEGVSPVESAAAYATFARGGTYIEPFSYTKVQLTETGEELKVTPKKVDAMSESTAYLINMILKYAVTSGSVGAGSVSGTDLCAKTGTTTVDSAAKKAAGIKGGIIGDSWEVAYSPDYAIATWYGYDKQLDPEFHLTSSEGGNARKTITKLLTKGIMEKNSRFKMPSSVVTAEIELGTDPLMLASEYTPANLRSNEYFKKDTEPTEVSDRFSKLSDPTNLKYSSTSSQVTLSWTAAPTPNAINTEYLKDYFSKNVYARWADKYLNERISYNNSTFGSFGYRVYMTNSSGTRELGFTTSTTYTINTYIDESTTFTVRASYANFPANQSSGISTKVAANSSTMGGNNDTPAQTTASINITPVLSCYTVDTYNNLGPAPGDKIKVTSNGSDITSKASISANCFQDGSETSCNSMVNGNSYTVKFTVRYGGNNRSKEITISPNC